MTNEDQKMLESALWHISNSVTNGKSQTAECEITQWLKSKINLSVEQPSKDLEEEIKKYFASVDLKAITFADIARHFAQWQKEQTINKACEWLRENIYIRVYKCNDGLGFPTAAFLADFKKAMEE